MRQSSDFKISTDPVKKVKRFTYMKITKHQINTKKEKGKGKWKEEINLP